MRGPPHRPLLHHAATGGRPLRFIMIWLAACMKKKCMVKAAHQVTGTTLGHAEISLLGGIDGSEIIFSLPPDDFATNMAK